MKKLINNIIFYSGGIFTFLLIFLFFLSFCIFTKNSYDNLKNYQLVINVKSDFIKEKKDHLINLFLSNQKTYQFGKDFFIFEQNDQKYHQFSSYLNNLDEIKFNKLFEDLWIILNLTRDFDFYDRFQEIYISFLDINFDKSSKVKFITDIFSTNTTKLKKLKLKFSEYTSNVIRQDLMQKNKICRTTLGKVFSENMGEKSFSYYNDESFYYTEQTLNQDFFFHKNNKIYSILPSLASTLLIGIFVIVTILTLSIFTGIYLDIFVDEESYRITKIIKKIFLKILELYQFLPEILLAIFCYSFFIYTLKIQSNSITFFGINLSLIIFPILVNIVLRSLKLLTQNLKESLHMADSKIKFIISDILPLISPYVVFHAIKTIAYISNFGLLFFIAGNFEYSKITPYGFSNNFSSMNQDIFAFAFSDNQNIHLITPVILTLVLINILLHSLAFFVKRFISIDFY
jgi:ABC-type phosphate transport system permease subunit